MGFDGSILVLISPYRSLWVFKSLYGFYRSSLVCIDPHGALCVVIGPYGSLLVPMCLYVF